MIAVQFIISLVMILAGMTICIYNREIGEFAAREMNINFGFRTLKALTEMLWFPRFSAIILGLLILAGGLRGILQFFGLA